MSEVWRPQSPRFGIVSLQSLAFLASEVVPSIVGFAFLAGFRGLAFRGMAFLASEVVPGVRGLALPASKV